jgi:hypothetical protein
VRRGHARTQLQIIDGEDDGSRRLAKAKNETGNFHLERHNLWSYASTMGVLVMRE